MPHSFLSSVFQRTSALLLCLGAVSSWAQPSAPAKSPQASTSKLAHFEGQPAKPMRWLATTVPVLESRLISDPLGQPAASHDWEPSPSLPLPWVTFADLGFKASSSSHSNSRDENWAWGKPFESKVMAAGSGGFGNFSAMHFPKLKGTVYAFTDAPLGSKLGALKVNHDMHRTLLFTGFLIDVKQTGRVGHSVMQDVVDGWNTTQALLGHLKPQMRSLQAKADAQKTTVKLFSNDPDDDPYIASAHVLNNDLTRPASSQPDPIANALCSAALAELKTGSPEKSQIIAERWGKWTAQKSPTPRPAWVLPCSVKKYLLSRTGPRSVYLVEINSKRTGKEGPGGEYALAPKQEEANFPRDVRGFYELDDKGLPLAVRFQKRTSRLNNSDQSVAIVKRLSSFNELDLPHEDDHVEFIGVLDLNPANKGKPAALAQIITGPHYEYVGPKVYTPSAQVGGLWQMRELNVPPPGFWMH